MTDKRPLDERIDEVVVGLADADERAEIERLAAADPVVAAKLEQARARFVALDETATPEAIPQEMWDGVLAALDAPVADTDEAGDDTVVPFVPTAPPRAMVWATFSSLAASVVLAFALGWALFTRPEPTVIAVLIDAVGQPVALVEGAADNTTTVTLLGPTNVPEGRIMQVWTKPDAAGPPVSVGLMDQPQSTRLVVEGLPAPSENQLYEITFEQPGGSPTNLPTGPIHGKGLAQLPL